MVLDVSPEGQYFLGQNFRGLHVHVSDFKRLILYFTVSYLSCIFSAALAQLRVKPVTTNSHNCADYCDYNRWFTCLNILTTRFTMTIRVRRYKTAKNIQLFLPRIPVLWRYRSRTLTRPAVKLLSCSSTAFCFSTSFSRIDVRDLEFSLL